jgi:hypothetical protein
MSNYYSVSFILYLNTAATTGHVPEDEGYLCDKATVFGAWIKGTLCIKTKLNSMALVRERTIPTERPPPVGEVSANFCG